MCHLRYLAVGISLVLGMYHAVYYAASSAVVFINKVPTKLYAQSYLLQVASFKSVDNANRYCEYIKKKTHSPVFIDHKKYYRIMVGPLTSFQAIRNQASMLRQPETRPALSKPQKSQNVTPIVYTAPLSNQFGQQQQWYGMLGGGAQWTHAASTMEIPNGSPYPYPESIDLFSVDNAARSGMFIFSAGSRWECDREWLTAYSLGIYYQYLMSHTINGSIMQYSVPEFNNYSYQWKTVANIVQLLGKINYYHIKQYLPFVQLGIGVALNQTTGYTETAYSGVTARGSPGYMNNTTSHFTYSLGAGIDYQVQPAWIISVGYQYQYIGTIKSGNGITTWSSTRLSLDNVAQNELFISLTWTC